MQVNEMLDHLANNQAVLTGMHFVYTDGGHGPAYINMRRVGHDGVFLAEVGEDLADKVASYTPEVIIGPETLGRTLATHTGNALNGVIVIWCDIVEDEKGLKQAVLSAKMDFARLLPGKRVAIVDDLLTTGSSIRLTAECVEEAGGEVVVAAAAVRRTPEVDAKKCSVPALEVLAEVEGFEVLTEEECLQRGPCSRLEPVVLRPGHGWKWQASHPNYEGDFTTLQ